MKFSDVLNHEAGYGACIQSLKNSNQPSMRYTLVENQEAKFD